MIRITFKTGKTEDVAKATAARGQEDWVVLAQADDQVIKMVPRENVESIDLYPGATQ